ncbi:MAG: zonular occludens toxin domain-containing protein [Prosthecobacter sp.]|nr:zonular occludens toxin domain-containing protein [Prosthecobacter sp.]
MSFSLYTGLMGGGKSYAAVEVALKAAKEGALVHTNLPLVQEAWEELGLWDKIVILPREPSRWISFKKQEIDGEMTDVPSSDCITGGAEGRENLVIFDEASIVFRTKDQLKNKDRHQPVFDLVALSRHVGLEIFFIAQHEDNISADLRKLAQFRTKCIKASEIPMIGPFAARFFGDFKRVVYKGMGRDPFMSSWHRFNASIGKLYKTHGMADSVAMRVDATRKTKGMDTSKKKGLLIFVGGPLLCLLLLGGAMWKAKHDLFDKPKAEALAKEGKLKADKKEGAAGAESHDKTPTKTKGGWRVMEWDAEDELVLGAKISTSRGVTVYTRGGTSLSVGGYYLGEPITEYVTWGGWYYFKTIFGRLIVVRPLNASERKELPPVTVQGQPSQQGNQPQATPMTPITEGLNHLTDKIRGT